MPPIMILVREKSPLIWPLAACVLLTGALFSRSLLAEKITYLSDLENAVLDELNLARTNPQTYVRILEDYRRQFKGRLVQRPGKIDLQTIEGTAAVDEAIRALKQRQPMAGFRVSRGMSRAAMDHVKDTGPRGTTGHQGADGSSPFTRMQRYGAYARAAAENIGYGNESGREVVIQLIVDDGVRSRGHRNNILDDRLQVVGIACGPHRKYAVMCVQTFASDYEEK